MSTAFITSGLWPEITKAAKANRQRCAVAVAYFGQSAARLLPLPQGSRLVVDASEGAVKSGQTCPGDLLAMVKRGIRVFSVPNLHAKVFVLGKVAFIGSANASRRSAGTLIEAALRTREPSAVRAAREFVESHCLHELTPELLKRLRKLYRPPRIAGGKRWKSRTAVDSVSRPTLPRLLLAQLEIEEWSEREQSLHDVGLPTARKRREHPRSFELDSFISTGKCPYRRGDVVIQVTDEGGGKVFVSPPGNVLHTRAGRDGNAIKTSVFIERPARRRREIKALARSVGRGALKRLQDGGQVRDAAFGQALLNIWSR